MADVKISALPASTVPLAGTEVLPIVQSGVTKQVSIANVQAAPVAAGLANGVQYLDASKVPSTNANMSFNGTNLLLGTTTSVVRATVSGADASPPALGTAAGTAFFSNTNPAYGLLFGTSTGGWSWMQSQRVSGAATAYDLILQPSGGGVNIGDSTTAIGNGNLRVAGTIKPGQYTTAAAPAYVKGAIYFDLTLNKLRVGGATGWETITSV
jgi:hypothetical protein